MKKLSLYIFLGLLWCNVGFADDPARLGIGKKRLNLNFNCTFAEALMLKQGFPKKAVESLKKYKEDFGYQEYNHPEYGTLLIKLKYDHNKNEYAFPDSIAVMVKSKIEGTTLIKSYYYGGETLFELENYHLGGQKFILYKYTYKVDKENKKKFDKKFDALINLPSDDFVKSLYILTTDFYEYAKKNQGKHYFYVPYNCRRS